MAFAPNNQKTCLPNPPARETLSLSFRCSSRLFAHVGGSSPPQKGQNSVYTILYPPQSWLTWMAWPMGRRIHPNTKLVVPYTSVGRVDTQMIHVSWSPPLQRQGSVQIVRAAQGRPASAAPHRRRGVYAGSGGDVGPTGRKARKFRASKPWVSSRSYLKPLH